MTSKEYIEQVIAIGHGFYDIHQNDDIWWIKVAPFFYRPVDVMQTIEIGQAKPKPHKALLGYCHMLTNNNNANKTWSMLFLSELKLNSFEIKSLSSSARAQVRKGLRLNDIKKIDNIEPLLEDMREICISKAQRTQHGRPPEYYNDKWKKEIMKEFSVDKNAKDRWGAFHQGSLIAFMNTVLVEGTMFISFAASHTDHLDKCPNDALIFTILNNCREMKECKNVQFGDWSDVPSLNKFKQKFCFEKVDFPVYAKYSIFIPIAKNMQKFIQQFRKIIKK